MTPKKLEGVIIAMPTPLLPNEDIDIVSTRKLIDYCIDQGVKGIMILGTMGEGVSLVDAQRQVMVDTTVQHVAGRVPVLATVSATSTRRGIEYIKAIENSGVDYIVITTAYYYKFPDPISLLQQIEAMTNAADIPFIFYNAPGFTGNPVDVDTIDKILNMEKIVGIKDSSCNFGNFVELLRRYPDKATRPGTIMQGDESVFDASIMMGADGVVSGGGVLFIKDVLSLYEVSKALDHQKAMLLQQNFTKLLMHVLMPNPQRNWVFNIKKVLADKKIIESPTVTAPFLTN
jgi:4-hydroxy-tetrahydrodipicolinate synthase